MCLYNFLDDWDTPEKHSKNVRYVPIQIEGQASTSTPNEPLKMNRVRNVPIKLVGFSENGPSTPSRKPRKHTPVRPVCALLDDDNEEPEVSIL